MITVAAGTESKLKLRAIEEALKRLGMEAQVLPTELLSVVSSQPFGFEDMMLGASFRANSARRHHDATYGVGIESGLVGLGGFWFDVPCVFITTLIPTPATSVSYGTFFPISQAIVEEVQERQIEVGFVIQERAGGGEKDAEKWLSRGKVPRDEILVQAIMSAFAPMQNPDRYE